MCCLVLFITSYGKLGRLPTTTNEFEAQDTYFKNY